MGLWWQDVQTTKARDATRVMPTIPETGWTPPREYPNLTAANVLSIDVETYDPDLETHGPGWARGSGHICGFSVGTDDGYKWYFPIRHTVDPGDNLDPEKSLAWLRETLRNPRQPKVGAHLLYDVGWLKREGIDVLGPLIDVQFAGALLAETEKVSLEDLGQRFLGEGKAGELLYRWCSDYYGGANTHTQRKNIYRAPPKLVGPYGEGDADLPIRLMPELYRHLQIEGLWELFNMECELIPLLVEMRMAGVCVDVERAQQVHEALNARAKIAHADLDSAAGMQININSGQSLAKLFDKLGLYYPRTPINIETKKGNNPSFTKQFLESVEHPIASKISEIRRLEKLNGTFIKGYILEGNSNGKIFCEFHPLRGSDGGTRSGRFSSSNPNLQNIPIRDPELGKMIRSLFIPDPGHKGWIKFDYSQIEYRFLVHYAVGAGAAEARARYNAEPKTDYHRWTQELVEKEAGKSLDRRTIKTLNFGLIYGMGKDKLQRSLGFETPEEAENFFNIYHRGVPFARETMNDSSAMVKETVAKAPVIAGERTGYITTILNRRSRFSLWGPKKYEVGQQPYPYWLALQKWGAGNITLAFVHKALNRRLQGSAADLMKVAMLKCWKDGLFHEVGVPRLTVHDELDFSDPGGKDNIFMEIKRVLETCMPLSIPIRAEMTTGPNWGAE
jgi:DNA polymerase-1